MIVLKPMAIVIHKPIKEIVIVIQKYKKRIFKQKKKKEKEKKNKRNRNSACYHLASKQAK